jgi:hypothetical protein
MNDSEGVEMPFRDFSEAEDDEDHEDWKSSQSPEGTVEVSSGLKASRDSPSKKGER